MDVEDALLYDTRRQPLERGVILFSYRQDVKGAARRDFGGTIEFHLEDVDTFKNPEFLLDTAAACIAEYNDRVSRE